MTWTRNARDVQAWELEGAKVASLVDAWVYERVADEDCVMLG